MREENKNRNSWRVWLLFAVLLASGAGIHWWQRAGEAKVARRPLSEFPAQLGEWRQVGADQRFTPEAEAVLRADDYVVKNYAAPDGRMASLYVGYYVTQRTGATYHSPLNCLPGSGWEMIDPAVVRVGPRNGAPAFEANRYIVQKGNDRQILLYWYQGRGRAVASEYRDKLYAVLDSARRRRSDGAMVRIMLPAGNSETAALAAATDLAAQTAPALPAFVPD